MDNWTGKARAGDVVVGKKGRRFVLTGYCDEAWMLAEIKDGKTVEDLMDSLSCDYEVSDYYLKTNFLLESPDVQSQTPPEVND
jgi:hypothetical protein